MGESIKKILIKFDNDVKENVDSIIITSIGIAIFMLAEEMGILDGNETNEWAFALFIGFLAFAFPIIVGFSIRWLQKHPRNALIYFATVFVLLAFYTIPYDPENRFEILRLLVITLGGLGAFYGLIIASRNRVNLKNK